MQVIGKARRDFDITDRQTGQPVHMSGFTIFYRYEDDKVSGVACDKVFLSDTKCANSGYTPEVGDEIQILYNRYGKVDSVICVKAYHG